MLFRSVDAVVASTVAKILANQRGDGGFGGGGVNGVGASSGSMSGGARPQTAEIMKTFGQRCPEVTVTINKERADYIVILQHEGGKELFRRDNKFALFNKEGDMIESNSTRKLGNAVKEACSRIASSEARRRD